VSITTTVPGVSICRAASKLITTVACQFQYYVLFPFTFEKIGASVVAALMAPSTSERGINRNHAE